MRYYIVEDDPNIVLILKQIISDCDLGTVVGASHDGLIALEEIQLLKPDIALVDLFIPSLDGLSLVQKLNNDTAVIMISQVSAKDMIGKAYESGVKFFVQKPINAVEVRSVITMVKDSIESDRTLNQIKSMFSLNTDQSGMSPSPSTPSTCEARIESVLRELGIIGDNGSDTITECVRWLIEHPNTLNEMSLKKFFSQFSQQPKSFEQRIRRTAATALNNLAHMGIEDYANPFFQEYAHVLFPFKEVRAEMNGITSKNKNHGTVNIRKFLDGLSHLCSNSTDI